jgi:hypothetical protein
MSATDHKINEVIAESLGVSMGTCLERLMFKLRAHETARTGPLQGLSISRTGRARALYEYDSREWETVADLVAWAME